MLVPLLCMSTSFDIVASLNIHGVQTSFSLTMLSLLLVSLLETLLLTMCLFKNLSPSMLLFRITLFPTHPPGAVSFLFFLGLTPHLSPLSIFFLLYYNFLNSSLLAYLLSLSLLWSSGFILSSHHFNIFWILSFNTLILLTRSIFSLSFPLRFILPKCEGVYSTILSSSMHIDNFSMNKILIHNKISPNNLF
jgi:hypothetical protein